MTDKMLRSGAEMYASDAQSNITRNRITATERHLGQLCDTMSSYTRKVAKCRDKGDQFAKDLRNYAEYECMSLTLKEGLTNFAEHFSTIQDHKQAEVSRLEGKVIVPLSNYGLMCKQTKSELKAAFSARDKESSQKKKLEKMREKNPGDRRQLVSAETNLQKASVEASRSSKALEQHMDTFEIKKVQDLKKIMTEFVNIEMLFHAKALEVYTKCFKALAVIDPDADLQEFQKQTRPPSAPSVNRSKVARRLSEGFETGTPPPSPHSNQLNSAKSTPTHSSSCTASHVMRTVAQVKTQNESEDDETDDDDDDDDDEDDDDSYDEDTTEADTARTGEHYTSKIVHFPMHTSIDDPMATVRSYDVTVTSSTTIVRKG